MAKRRKRRAKRRIRKKPKRKRKRVYVTLSASTIRKLKLMKGSCKSKSRAIDKAVRAYSR